MLIFLIILYIVISLLVGVPVVLGFYIFDPTAIYNKWYRHIVYSISGIGHGLLWPVWLIHILIVEPIEESKNDHIN